MSFNDLLSAVTALPPDEKQRLFNVLSNQLAPEAIPPEYFVPGAVVYPGSHVTTDEAGWKVILEATGIGTSG